MSDWKSRAKPIQSGFDLQHFGGIKQTRTAKPITLEPITSDIVVDGELMEPVPMVQEDWKSRAKPIQRTAQKKPAQPDKIGLARTAFDQAMQGATFGFADEVMDPLGAVIATGLRNPKALFTGNVDENLADSLVNARKNTQERLKQEFEQNPVTSFTSNIAGGLVTGGAGATTRAGTAIGNLVRSGDIGARIAKGAVAGAASGGLYGVGSGEDGERAGSGIRGALLGGAIGTAAPLAGYAVKGLQNNIKGLNARGEEALAESLDQLKSKSSASYQAMRQNGASFSPQASQRIINNLKTRLTADGELDPVLHQSSLRALKLLEDKASKGTLTLEGLDQSRQLLGDIAGNFSDKVNARKASLLINAIDDAVGSVQPTDLAKGSRSAVEALQNARKQYATSRKFEMVSDVLKRADGDPNKIKSGLRSLLNNKKAVRGFSPAEYKALENAAKYSGGEGITKALGKFGFDLGTSQTMGNTALPVLSGLATSAVSGAATGGAVPAIGTAARVSQKLLARGKAEELLKVIENGGKVSTKQIMQLPPKQAKALLATLRQTNMSAGRSLVAAEQ